MLNDRRSKELLAVARGNGRYVQRDLPLIQVTAVTHRANPVFPAMLTGLPPSEESWISSLVERFALPILRRQLPEVVDIHQPIASAGRNLLFVSLQKTAAHQVRRVFHALWGMEQFEQTKMIIIVDADLNLRDENQVWLNVGRYACPRRDFQFSDGLSRDDDYTSASNSLAARVGIDATRKRTDELEHPWPESLACSNEILARYANDGPNMVLNVSMTSDP